MASAIHQLVAVDDNGTSDPFDGDLRSASRQCPYFSAGKDAKIMATATSMARRIVILVAASR